MVIWYTRFSGNWPVSWRNCNILGIEQKTPATTTQNKLTMISDEQLNTLAITFGIVMMTLIVIYHAVGSTMSPKN
nr:AIS_HP1_G0006560.mRNA.1.CDS.1 [Saccharomyces cerevisiae]